jgi:hypothetical protein
VLTNVNAYTCIHVHMMHMNTTVTNTGIHLFINTIVMRTHDTPHRKNRLTNANAYAHLRLFINMLVMHARDTPHRKSRLTNANAYAHLRLFINMLVMHSRDTPHRKCSANKRKCIRMHTRTHDVHNGNAHTQSNNAYSAAMHSTGLTRIIRCIYGIFGREITKYR